MGFISFGLLQTQTENILNYKSKFQTSTTLTIVIITCKIVDNMFERCKLFISAIYPNRVFSKI